MSLSEVTVSLVKDACSARNTCVKGIGTKGASIVGTYVGRVCIKGVCTNSTCVEGASTRVASDKCAYVEIFYAVERLEIHSYFFWIFKVRGGTGLKIQVRPDYTCINNA